MDAVYAILQRQAAEEPGHPDPALCRWSCLWGDSRGDKLQQHVHQLPSFVLDRLVRVLQDLLWWYTAQVSHNSQAGRGRRYPLSRPAGADQGGYVCTPGLPSELHLG